MTIQPQVIDTVGVKSTSADVQLHGLWQQGDGFHVVVHPDTLLVQDVSKPDGLWGWSWDAWSGTGQWFGPLAVFLLTLLFAWFGRQLQMRRRQKADVAHFRGWKPHIIGSMKNQLQKLEHFFSAFDITDNPSIPPPMLLKSQIETDLWLSLSATEMSRVFVLNKLGKIKDKTRDVQSVLLNTRSINGNIAKAIDTAHMLSKELELFKQDWNEQNRAVKDHFLKLTDPKNADMDDTVRNLLDDLHIQFNKSNGKLTDRRSVLNNLLPFLREEYDRSKSNDIAELTLRIVRLIQSIDQLFATDEQGRRNLEMYFPEIRSGIEGLEQASDRIIARKDRWFMQLL